MSASLESLAWLSLAAYALHSVVRLSDRVLTVMEARYKPVAFGELLQPIITLVTLLQPLFALRQQEDSASTTSEEESDTESHVFTPRHAEVVQPVSSPSLDVLLADEAQQPPPSSPIQQQTLDKADKLD